MTAVTNTSEKGAWPTTVQPSLVCPATGLPRVSLVRSLSGQVWVFHQIRDKKIDAGQGGLATGTSSVLCARASLDGGVMGSGKGESLFSPQLSYVLGLGKFQRQYLEMTSTLIRLHPQSASVAVHGPRPRSCPGWAALRVVPH